MGRSAPIGSGSTARGAGTRREPGRALLSATVRVLGVAPAAVDAPLRRHRESATAVDDRSGWSALLRIRRDDVGAVGVDRDGARPRPASQGGHGYTASRRA